MNLHATSSKRKYTALAQLAQNAGMNHMLTTASRLLSLKRPTSLAC
jgi:hypothetical protein